ncbi:ABC transporter permease [Crossiella sp. CA-258035]|uniref:ABC transporter permease n=1 Tax=Crossiella sp. CA-258035 TaxID=2981138 RepID=UPI0024BD442E|nr:ABC transporter permease [Crossiella sp. CA-258035]WHT23635.1 ABC transporter permease [Crossiella sp. CA-258035]
MLRMLLGRLLALVPLLLGVTLFVFVVMRFSPVDPALAAFDGANATPEQLERFRRENGLLDPLPVQYLRFVWLLLHGDFGTSLITKQSVAETITTALPLTVQLTLLGLVISLLLAVPLGVLSALFRDRWPDQLIRLVTLAGVAAPAFWIALLLVQWLAVGQGLFPTSGYISPADSLGGWLNSMALPAVSLALPVAAQLTRIIRTSMVEELDKDYVRTARGGGLPPVVVVGRNVLRNAMVTPLTVLGLRLGYLLGGAVVIETMFALPGMGQNMIQAVTDGDTAKVQGFVITIALGFVLVNLIVDILYLIANPRLRSHS